MKHNSTGTINNTTNVTVGGGREYPFWIWLMNTAVLAAI